MLHKLPNNNLISSGLILLAPTVRQLNIFVHKFLNNSYRTFHEGTKIC